MPRFKDQAICIRDLDWSETSQVVVLLTEAHGKVRGLAKGSRRQSPSSVQRFSGGIELLTAGQVVATTRPSSELAAITEWDLQSDYFPLRRRFRGQRLAMYAADVCNALLADADPHPGVFTLLRGFLEALCSTPPPLRERPGEGAEASKVSLSSGSLVSPPSPPPSPSRERGSEDDSREIDAALLRFQWGLLEDLGYKPELERDVRDGGPLKSVPTYTFDPVAGGLTSGHGVADWRVRRGTVEALRGIAADEMDGNTDAAALQRANRLLCVYIRALLDKELPTMEIVLGAA